MKDFSPQTWFVRIVTNMRSALHSSAGEISKNSTTLMWQKKVLVNMFNSALSTTPPTLLDWPHVWILACIIFVFITLFFYVVILVKDKIRARSLILKIFPMFFQACTSYRNFPTWLHFFLQQVFVMALPVSFQIIVVFSHLMTTNCTAHSRHPDIHIYTSFSWSIL